MNASDTYDFRAVRALAQRFGECIKERVEREYILFANHIDTVPSVLDIGCGLGFMDILLARHHSTKEIHLLDGDGCGPKRLGYNGEETVPWGDVKIGADFVNDNVPSDVEVSAYLWSADHWPEHVDLVMSLWSWGYHYPVSVYASEMIERYPDALVMLDLRNRVDHVAMWNAGYQAKALVEKNNKARRVIFERRTQ